MSRIYIISHFAKLAQESGNDRVATLIEHLKQAHEVTLITSDFNHHKKVFRSTSDTVVEDGSYEVKLIHESGYKKNVSIQRLMSARVLAKNLSAFLDTAKKPDIIYCLSPSLDFAESAITYAQRSGIKVIVDIQDLWPEAFRLAFNVPIVSDILFYPMYRQARAIYKRADRLVAVSDTYAQHALSLTNKIDSSGGDLPVVAYLGTELAQFDMYRVRRSAQADTAITIAYVGTLGKSYNLKLIIDAIGMLDNDKVRLLVMGDGSDRQDLTEYARQVGVSAEFSGVLPYSEMVAMLSSSDIAVNPIHDRSAGSIINKVGDYAAAGLPVINTQISEEYRNLVSEYGFGFNCSNDDPADIADKIKYLIENPDIRKKMGLNNRRLAEERFDRAKTYTEIYDAIEKYIGQA